MFCHYFNDLDALFYNDFGNYANILFIIFPISRYIEYAGTLVLFIWVLMNYFKLNMYLILCVGLIC